MPRVGRNQVDQRAMRFAALISAVLLGLALAFGPVYGLPLLAIQTFVFALGAVMGLEASPYLAIYRRYVAPRRESTPEPGPKRPQRFTQVLGMLLGITAMLVGVLSMTVTYYVLVGILFAAAALHAATGRCLGCDLYHRLAVSAAAPASPIQPVDEPVNRTTSRDVHDSHA